MIKHRSTNRSDFEVDSCGLGDWHVGSLPDSRMREASAKRNIALSTRARVFSPDDIEQFDYLFAADKQVYNELMQHAETPQAKKKIHLMTAFSSLYKGQDVPDPYLGGEEDFELVLDILEDSCDGILIQLNLQ